MAYWLLKSDPDSYPWRRMAADGRTAWDGVRNHQAANNLKAMREGDRAFFYHSQADKAIVGIVEIVEEYHPDPSDASGRFGMVEVEAVEALPAPVTLAQVKAEPRLKDLALVRHTRLSVMPIDAPSWALICRMGGVPA
jgi:predicted RNA-binding protein with PUA-like domain